MDFFSNLPWEQWTEQMLEEDSGRHEKSTLGMCVCVLTITIYQGLQILTLLSVMAGWKNFF